MASLDAITGALGTKRASHLLHRLTFGPSRQEVDVFASKTISDALTELLTVPLPPATPAWVGTKANEGDAREYFRCWLYGNMFNAGTNAIEKLTFFLHTHFTAIGSVIDNGSALYYQNQLLRKYALGNFKELALKICIDNAMLILLDNTLNENVRPNENYAREFLELYTIGKGVEIGPGNYTTYTEGDVQAAAKILSGWKKEMTFATLDATTGLPVGAMPTNASQLASKHDATIKTFSAAFQNTVIQPTTVTNKLTTVADATEELKQMVDMIFRQEATARNICRKLYRFFVYYKIPDDVENNVITPLAQTFIANNFDLKPVLLQLFQSQHFFDADDAQAADDKRGAIIKSPLEITIGMMRFFHITLPDSTTDPQTFYDTVGGILDAMEDQGFNLYEPLDVAGYDAYFQGPGYNRNWISPNYLARRYQFAKYILSGENKGGKPWSLKVDTIAYANNTANISDPYDAEKIVNELITYLLPEAITPERYNFFLNILLDNLTTLNWKNEWGAYKNSNNDMGVRTQLNALVNALLQSAEYQLS